MKKKGKKKPEEMKKPEGKKEGRKKKTNVDQDSISDSESSRRRRRREVDIKLTDFDEEIVACDEKLKELLREDKRYACLEEKFRVFL